jgi:DNA repair exonuclease SbcCD ATPase subunit
MAIIFEKLQYKNFLSVGDNEITIDLNSSRSTLIVGHNGSGKSLMLDALSFVLFGKPHRNINKPQLVNSINGKNCLVTIWFKLNTSDYKIIRGLKPNIFEIWQNGILINQESHSRDYQKLLETNILKLNHKSFHQIVVLGSSNFIPFMQLSTQHRREVIEDLLDIGVFSKMNMLLKESSTKLRDQIRDSELHISTIKEKISLQSSHIDSLQQLSKTNNSQYLSEIETLNKNILTMLDENAALSHEYSENYGKKAQQLKRNEKTKSTLVSYQHQIRDNISKLVNDSKFYETNETCPTCSQNIDYDFRQTKIKGCAHSAKELNDGYSKLKKSLEDVEQSLKNTSEEIARLRQLDNKIQSNQTLIEGITARINNLTTLANAHHEYSEVTDAQTKLNELYAEKTRLEEYRGTQLEERMYNEVIAELLKDTGIKTKIIRQYLPVMNKLINQYLQILDFFVLFNLDENFNETIRSRHRDDFSYSSFSEGEKQRINLSLLFAWRQIAKMKNSASTNILILDEVFDASLDSDGIDNLLRIMNSLDLDTRIFVISHKQDLLEGKFESKIEFEKVKNFTEIKEIS